ncbi:MAG: hypothetical protein A2X36_06060 [Elusimicrobia bacterium GWA2_69_24]|nr:MAG: hypothetical protein A2X36_06060 [Elusimicrobia bacterium GWA2_69_24]HBL18233.1 hypothetical protein [Elusimicrobiota bacterium]
MRLLLLVLAAASAFAEYKPDLANGARLNKEAEMIAAQVRAAERKELVRPAPKGFQPEPFDKKIKVVLFARDKSIRVGETFWYRIEIQNRGRKPVHYWEKPSFLKDGMRYDMGRWDFQATLPDGTTKRLVIGTLADEWGMADRTKRPIQVPGAEKMTDAEIQDWVRRNEVRRRAEADLDVTLAPGETLLSRPWRWVSNSEHERLIAAGAAELWPRPEGPFSELWTSHRFELPGKYRIWVILDDHPVFGHPDEDTIKRLEARGVSREATIRHYREMDSECLGVLPSQSVGIEVLP